MLLTKVYAQGFGAGNPAVEILDENIIVAAGLHLGKTNYLLFLTHIVDIDKLGIAQCKAALDNIGKRIRRIKRGKTRYVKLHGAAVKHRVIAYRRILYGARIDEVADSAGFHQLRDIVADTCILNGNDVDTEALNRLCRTARGVELNA